MLSLRLNDMRYSTEMWGGISFVVWAQRLVPKKYAVFMLIFAFFVYLSDKNLKFFLSFVDFSISKRCFSVLEALYKAFT